MGRSKIKDLTNRRFSRWLVLFRADDYINGSGRASVRWFCLCDCGNRKIVHGSHLRNGSSTSCGCYNKELSTKHGLSRSGAYSSWWNMVKRCVNPSEKDSPHYKEKGITVCEDWLSFDNFYKDMGRDQKVLN